MKSSTYHHVALSFQNNHYVTNTYTIHHKPASKQELDEIIKHKNIINFIRAQRLSRLGHVERMQGTRMVKAI